MNGDFDKAALLEKIAEAVADAPEIKSAADVSMRIIASELPYYKWVGVYWLEGEVLVLGTFVGAPTEHDRIKVGLGVCGTAVAANKNQVIEDVRTLDNYLACSLETRSEIVVLIRDKSGVIIGQIDADGDCVGDFNADDEEFLEKVAALIASKL